MEKITRERDPFENYLMFVVVERIWRSFMFCGWGVHFESSIVALFGRSRQTVFLRCIGPSLLCWCIRQLCCLFLRPLLVNYATQKVDYATSMLHYVFMLLFTRCFMSKIVLRVLTDYSFQLLAERPRTLCRLFFKLSLPFQGFLQHFRTEKRFFFWPWQKNETEISLNMV